MSLEGGAAGGAAAWAPTHPLASCAALAGCAVDPKALSSEVRALVVEAARLHQRPGDTPSWQQQQQNGDAAAMELSPAQRLRLVVNAAAELSNLTATLVAVEAAVALHPGSLPEILQALHDGPRRALPTVIAALACSSGQALPGQQQQQQQQQANNVDPGGFQVMHSAPSTRHTPALARVRGDWHSDEAAAAAAGHVNIPAPQAAAPAPSFFSPRDPRAARLARLSGDPASSVGTPPAPYGSPTPDHQHTTQQPPEQRSEGPEAAAAAAAGVLGGLTAADVLLLLTLRGRGPVNDELIAVALCSAVQGTSREALSNTIAALSDLSDEAVEWVFGVALAWLGTVVVDLPSLEVAGRHLLAAALTAAPDTCRAGLRLLLQRLQSEACVEGPLWGALAELATAAAAALSTRQPHQTDQQRQASPKIAPQVAEIAVGELLAFVGARLMALPPGVGARLVSAITPLVALLPQLAALLCRASIDALSAAAVRRAGLLVKPEVGAGGASPAAKGLRETAAAAPAAPGGPVGLKVAASGGRNADADNDDSPGEEGAGNDLSRQLARARRALAPVSGAADTQLGVAPDSEEALVLACVEALLTHGSGDGSWAGPPVPNAAATQQVVMLRWLQESSPALLQRLLAIQPSADLAVSWQSALLTELGRLVGPAQGAHAAASSGFAGGNGALAPSPAWLWLESGVLPAGADASLPPPQLSLPVAPALLGAVLRSVLPASDATLGGSSSGGGRAQGLQSGGGEGDQDLRLPTDPDELARCGLRLCAILLQAIGDGGRSMAEAAAGSFAGGGRDGAARRAALLLTRVRTLGVLQRALLARPALGVLLALMHSAAPRAGASGSGCPGTACSAALDGAPCSSPACAALAQVERAAAAADGGWWEHQRAEQLLVPLQTLLCSETERLTGLAAAAVKEVLDGPEAEQLTGGVAAGGAASAGAASSDRQGSEGAEGGDMQQDQPRRQRRAPDASGFVVIWSTPGGTASSAPPPGMMSLAASAATAALRTLPPWLLQSPEPLPASCVRQLMALAAQQMQQVAAAGISGVGGPLSADAAALDALQLAVRSARAGLSAAERAVSMQRPDAGEAAGLAAECYKFYQVVAGVLAAVGAGPPLEGVVDGQGTSSTVTPSGRANRRSSSAAATVTPVATAEAAAEGATHTDGGRTASDSQLLALAGEALSLCARAISATASAVQKDSGARSGLKPTATLLLGDLIEALSPDAGRLAAALAALKQMHGCGVSMGTNSYHAAKRGAVANPLLSARLAVVGLMQRLVQWQVVREPQPEGSGDGSEAAAAAAAVPSQVAPLLQGWLELQHALSRAWAVDRPAACGPGNALRGVVPSEADAQRCEVLIGDLLDHLVLDDSLPASLATPDAACRLAAVAACGAAGPRPAIAVLVVHTAVLRHGQVAYAPRLGGSWTSLGVAPMWLRHAGPEASRAAAAEAAEHLAVALERQNATVPAPEPLSARGSTLAGHMVASKPLPPKNVLVLVAAGLEACAYLAGCGRLHGGEAAHKAASTAPSPAHLDLAARILLALACDAGPCAAAAAALLSDVSAPPKADGERGSVDRQARKAARARKALAARLVALGKSVCAAARRLLEQHPGGGGKARRGGPPPAAWTQLPHAVQRLRALNSQLQAAVNSAGDVQDGEAPSVGVVVRTHLQVALEACASLPAREAALLEAEETAKGHRGDYGLGSEEEDGSDSSDDDGREPEVRETLLPGLLLGFGSDSDSESGSQLSEGEMDGDNVSGGGVGGRQPRGGWGARRPVDEAAQQERLKLLLGPGAVLRPPLQKKTQSAPVRPKGPAAATAPSPVQPASTSGQGSAGPQSKHPQQAAAPAGSAAQPKAGAGPSPLPPAGPAAAAPSSAPRSGGTGGIAAAALMAARAAASGRSGGAGATPSRSAQPPRPPPPQQQVPSTPLPSLPGIPTPGRGQEVQRTAGATGSGKATNGKATSGKGPSKASGGKGGSATRVAMVTVNSTAADAGGANTVARTLPARDSSGRFLPSGNSSAKRPAAAADAAAAGPSGGSKRSKAVASGPPRSSGAKAPPPPVLDANSSEEEKGSESDSGGGRSGTGQRRRSSRPQAAPRNPFMAAVLAMEPPRRGKPSKRARRNDSGSTQDQRSGGVASDDSASLELTSDYDSDTFSDLEDFVVCEPGRDYLGLMASKERARARQQRSLAGG